MSGCDLIFLLDPANHRPASGCILQAARGGKGFIDGTVLPITRQYTVVLDLPGRMTGQAKLRLRR